MKCNTLIKRIARVNLRGMKSTPQTTTIEQTIRMISLTARNEN
jgi:hypothetical protein